MLLPLDPWTAALLTGLLTLLLGRPAIGWLHRLKFGQAIRDEGPQSHHQKAGTPTLGGILFLLPALLLWPLVTVMDGRSWAVWGLVAGMGGLGALDDLLIILSRSNKGILPRWKMLGQVVMAIGFWWVLFQQGHEFKVLLPFAVHSLDLRGFYPLFCVIVVTGTVNAVNLTDGLDGLAAGTVAIALGPFTWLLAGRYGSTDPLVTGGLVLLGAVIGFLWFNSHPATVFMGDAGSLGLGGALAGLAVAGGLELYLLLAGFVFVLEALSVIAQVVAFQTTGRRILRMSPLHHHFELGGWPEALVVSRFYLLALLCACVTILAAGG